MKTLLIFLLSLVSLLAQDPQERIVLVPFNNAPKEIPLFFSATANVTSEVKLDTLTSEQRLHFTIHQGKPETLTLALTGAGDVTAVAGAGLRDWAVRVADDGARFLDIRPTLADDTKLTDLEVTVQTRLKLENGAGTLLLPSPGPATGFSLSIDLTSAPGVDLRVVKADGLSPVTGGNGRGFLGTTAANLEISAMPAGSGSRGLELRDATATGRLAADGNSVSFKLTGTARADAPGAAAELFGGGAALSGGVAGDGWHVVLRPDDRAYELVAEREGEFPVEIEFVAPVGRKGDWRQLDFKLPAGVVVPVRIEGLGADVTFDRARPVVPRREGDAWLGFLPADGVAALAWKPAGAVADGALFFSSTGTSDVRIGSGLMRQMTVIDLRVLQGKLPALSLTMDGPGEILSVTGDQVLGWSVGKERKLEIELNRAIEGGGRIVIEAQAALGAFPVKAEALRIVPDGALRHSGWLRIANDGAVRIEITNAAGLIQLAPAQFPGGVDESLRQVFVYRFPSADYNYVIQADQVLPETGVTEVTVYELGETDRSITSNIELDIREAPLREWEMEIPADHAVAAVTGAQVADYAVGGEAKDGMRKLKIIFKQPVIDRQLINVRLEKNEAAKAGAWKLQPLGFPGAKSRRGYIGAAAAAGYRLVAGKTAGVAEVPVTFFPNKIKGLQQSFRLREAAWSVDLTVEALGQSVQADVFHLYSLKAGSAYGSVLINYFVVGAPATEWRISVPDGIGNIEVTGQNVGRDWRREDNVVIVPLSSPLLGAGTVLLTFEQPMSARGGEIHPGEVRPLEVQAERGYVQVVSPLQVKFDKPIVMGPLLEIDASELPPEFRLLSSAPTLKAWQYTSRDFQIGMKIEWYESGETVAQVVDFMKLSTQVSRDGQWVTDARLFVKSKARGALRVTMPAGSKLWEAGVDGAAVNARADGAATLIPLPARTDPNEAVEVTLRYGATAASARHPRLAAPVLASPVVIADWTVAGDEGRQLVPRGGSAELVRPGLAESGWEWAARHPGNVGVLLLLGAAACGLSLAGNRTLALVFGLVFVVASLGVALSAAANGRGNEAILEYAAPVVAPGVEVAVEVGNLAPWQARTDWVAWILLALGVVVVVRGVWKGSRIWRGCGLALAGAAFLSIRGGAPLFFGISALIALAWWVPRVRQLVGKSRLPKAAATAAIFLAACCWNDARAAELPDHAKPAESMIQNWQIRDGRLRGTLEVTVRAEAGNRFLLLRPPAVLSGFQGEGMHVVKSPIDGKDAYFLVADAAGRLTGKATFEMPAANPADGWEVPGGPAALREITLRWDQPGWEFFSDGAAKISPLADLNQGESGAVLTLGPADPVSIRARAKQRDAGSEETRFFAEVSNLYQPAPGVVNGRHRIAIRPAQGRVAALVLAIPEGFTVSDVVDGPAGAWRFDPEKRELRVPIEPAQDQAFGLTVETQRSAGTLPMDLDLQPIRVQGAAGEIGFLALAFGDDAQPESVETDGLSRVNPEDFAQNLLPRDKDGNPLALLRNAFRYGPAEATAHVRVSAVEPELRADSWQLVSLGEDRLLVATDIRVSITRAGIFKLALEIPKDLEVETVTGEGLSHWTETADGGARVLTLHLTGRTLGERVFSLALTGRPPGPQKSWQVPRLSLRGASRETGLVTIVPERGLQVRAVVRKNVSRLDPKELADAPADSARAAARPGALAYRLLQADWALGLAIDRLDPWVTAKVFHEATLREGQVLTRVAIDWRIDNAALKSVRLRIPGLDETAAATVRASGAAVAEMVPVPGEDGLWEIHFQRGIAGETRTELEWQRATANKGAEEIRPVTLEGVRQVEYFAAIRAGGRLEVDAGEIPRGWQRADWAVVRSSLGALAGNVAPLMAFRVADPEGPLPVVLKRHDLADLQKLRVSEGTLTTLMSPRGDALTAVDLQLQVTAKATLRLSLPAGARLFNVLVNDEGAPLVREGEAWLFYVFPSPEVGQPASVRFVYSAGTGKGERLIGPKLDVPMENLTWRVLVPEGWKMTDHGGDFDLKEQSAMGSFRLEDYRSFVASKRANDSQSAVALLDQANGWLAAGDQEKASVAFSNAVRSNQLDAASGEDARVRLRELKTQQAVLGLNTRRQKLVLENGTATPQAGNAQLDRAAEANPVMRGDSNYDPRQFDRFFEGNTADENAALKEIANRIVTQQLAAEPAPVALDVTLPERGTVVTFARSVQVEGGKPMEITLALKRAGSGVAWLAIALCLVLGALGATRKRVV